MASSAAGWTLLLLPAAFWLSVAVWRAGETPGGWRRALGYFGWGTLGFPLAFCVQQLAFRGAGLDALGLGPGMLAALLVVGPSEEVFKAALARWRLGKAEALSNPAEARMSAMSAAAGYTFLEHFGVFSTGGAALWVLVLKATVGSSLHAMVSTVWGPVLGGIGWWRAALAAGLVHGVYDIFAFLPAWVGAPFWVAVAGQGCVIAGLAARDWRLSRGARLDYIEGPTPP